MAPNPPDAEDQLISQLEKAKLSQDGAVPAATADMPPSMAAKREYTADDLFRELNRYPLFMTQLPDEEITGEASDQLEALKALAYEGTRAEIALNFKNQGNEAVAEKRWIDAREFYDKAIAALRGPKVPVEEEEGLPDVRVVEIDEEADERRERELEAQVLANRALCQLEMKNYGSCTRDCAAALKIAPRNVKTWYRAASACFALEKLPEALDACACGLRVDSANAALKTLQAKAQTRLKLVEETNARRKEREERARLETNTLKHALAARNIATRATDSPPDMEDAAISLSNPVDAASSLSLPLIFLYPLAAQSDFVKACAETESLGEHLAYILPTPWDEKGEYTVESTECYMETREGGLIKAGKKLSLLKLLGSGKVEVLDGIISVNVVPKSQASSWIDEFKKRRGKK